MPAARPFPRHTLSNWASRALLLSLLWATTAVWGLPDDREQPIHITADKAVRDEKKGVTIYSGSVKMRQGSMELEADSLTIYHEAEKADQIVAKGKPAKMRQRPEPGAELVHAHAGIITYYKLEERVHLTRDARIEQKGDLVTGDSIDYLINQQLITAESDKSQKVVVVLQPTVQPVKPVASTPPGSDTGGEQQSTNSSTQVGPSGATDSE